MGRADKLSYRKRQRSGSSTPASEKDLWCTPKHIIRAISPMGILTDVATSKSNPVGAEIFYTEEDDGLRRFWPTQGLSWCNPPFKKKKDFLMKALMENVMGGSESVLLLPASVGAQWFRPAWSAKAICFVHGRVRFLNPNTLEPSKDAAMFDIVLVYFGVRTSVFEICARKLGKVVRL